MQLPRPKSSESFIVVKYFSQKAYNMHRLLLQSPEDFCVWYRILYVRNLPFNISSEEMYEIFGKFGAIRQMRLWVTVSQMALIFCLKDTSIYTHDRQSWSLVSPCQQSSWSLLGFGSCLWALIWALASLKIFAVLNHGPAIVQGKRKGHQRNSICGLRWYLRCKKCSGPSVRIQRRQSIPYSAVLQHFKTNKEGKYHLASVKVSKPLMPIPWWTIWSSKHWEVHRWKPQCQTLSVQEEHAVSSPNVIQFHFLATNLIELGVH